MTLAAYVHLHRSAESELADSLRILAVGHRAETDIQLIAQALAAHCDRHEQCLADLSGDGLDDSTQPGAPPAGLSSAREGPVGLVRDMQDVHHLASFVALNWLVLSQAAQAARDYELVAVIRQCQPDTDAQLAWLRTRLSLAVPQALTA